MIADFNSNTNEEEQTDLNYNKVEQLSLDAINPLIYYYSMDGNWSQQELPIEINRMRLGKNPYECEVKLLHPEADDVHIVIQRTGFYWQIIECGKKQLMHVNGLPRRQALLGHKKQVIIQVGEIVLIFSTDVLKPKLDEKQTVIDDDGALPEGHYGMNLNGLLKKFPYNEPCLIGSDSICHVPVSGPQFSAMVTNVDRKLFLSKLTTDSRTRILTDGTDLVEPTPLSPASRINVDNQEIIFKLSKDLRFTRTQQMTEDENLYETLQLVQMDEHGQPNFAYQLPKPVSNVTLGRSPTQAGITIENSSNLSRVHCQVITYDNSIMLLDNNSTNGCFVNGEYTKKSMVKVGDMIKLGNLEFILCYC